MPIFDTTPSARRIYASVTINGTSVPFVSAEVTNNNFFAADSFRAVLPLSAMPDGFGADFWGQCTSCEVAISAAVQPLAIGQAVTAAAPSTPSLQRLILGQADSLDIEFGANTVAITGRDYTSYFIDNQTTDHFNNQTSSQIANTLAARHGLNAIVTTTTQLAGTIYEIDKARIGAPDAKPVTEWNLLCYLAQNEGFDCYVSGNTLYFQPPSASSADPYVIKYTPATADSYQASNVARINVQRSIAIARDVIVYVRTWNQMQATPFTVSVKAQHPSASAKNGPPQTYYFTVPNQDQAGALRIAQQKANDICRHERILHYDGPGNIQITPRSILALSGAGPGFDQNYYIDEIRRTISVDGFEMNVRAKNHSVISQVTL